MSVHLGRLVLARHIYVGAYEPDVVDVRGRLGSVLQMAGRTEAGTRVAVGRPRPGPAADVLLNREVASAVLTEVVENALRYTALGGSVRVRCYLVGTRVRVSVSNAPACTIESREQPLLFEPGYRGESVQQRAPSLPGLGLTLVRAALDRAGGTIDLEQALLPGGDYETTCSLALPLAAHDP